jgi:hypothetical protein
MVEKITNEKLLYSIQKAIKSHGVFLMAVTDIGACECCDGKNHVQDKDELIEDKSFVYSIGHREAGRPDILVLTGTFNKDKKVSVETAKSKVLAASSLINSMVDRWNIQAVAEGHTAEDRDGNEYRVVSFEGNAVKEMFTIQASNYYGDLNYHLLVLLPKDAKFDSITWE